jgi:hypothetical protein
VLLIDIPVLMLLNDKPRSPSEASETNADETCLASSITWPVTVVSPTVTVSVPTEPLAPEPSAYSMSHVYPDFDLKVLLSEEV